MNGNRKLKFSLTTLSCSLYKHLNKFKNKYNLVIILFFKFLCNKLFKSLVFRLVNLT